MSGSAIRAGQAFIELTLKGRQQVEAALKSIAGKFSAMGSMLQKIGGTMVAAGGAILGPLAAMTKNFATVGAELDDMSKRTGVASDVLSQLGYAAGQSGTDLGAVSGAISKMQRSLIDAARGTGMAKEALDALGLTTEGLMSLTPDEQFIAIADAISKIEDPAMKAALAMAIFGKSGANLLPLLNEGAEGIRQMMQEAQDFGIGITQEDVAAAAELDDALHKLMEIVKGVGIQIGAALAPAVIQMVEWLQQAGKVVVDFVRENRGLVVTIAGVGAAILAAGAAVGGLGLAFSAVSTVIGGFVAAASAVAAVIGAVSLPVVAAITGIVALGVAIGAAVAWALKASGAFDALGVKFGETWKAIVGAVKAGELELAFSIAVAQVKLVWAEVMAGLKQMWDDFIQYIASKILSIPGAEKIFGEGAGQALTEDFAQRKDSRQKELERLRKELDSLKQEGLSVGAGGVISPPKGAKLSFVDTASAQIQAGTNAAVTGLQRGTFSGDFAQQRLGLGAIGPQERTAKATEAGAKTLKDILDEIKNSEGLTFA